MHMGRCFITMASVHDIPADAVGPATAMLTARSLAADIGAAFSQASLRVSIPAATGSEPSMCFDELFQVMTTLELPTVGVPPLDNGQLPLGSDMLPPLMRHLLSSLQVSVQGTFARGSGARSAFTRSWRGDEPGAATALDEATRAVSLNEDQTALTDETFAEGIFFSGRSCRVQWLCTASIGACVLTAYPRTKPGAGGVDISAIAHLRLDTILLTQSVAADPPQFPAYYSATPSHPYIAAADPLMVDVDLLSTLTDGVCIPDETPLERHKRIADSMCLLPLSSLAPGTLATDIVSPWHGASDLAARLKRAHEIESAAAASDADISLAGTPAAASSDGPQEVSLAGALVMGNVVLQRKATQRATVFPTLSVRIRTLLLPALAPIGAPAGSDSPMRSMLLSVELENAAAQGAFVVHKLDISITAPHKTPDDIYAAGEIRPVVHSASAPGHDAHVLPATLAPHDQTNVLYTVRLDGLHDGDINRLADLDAWPSQRGVRVVVYGGPERNGASVPSCASSWNGLLDLATLREEWQWRMFSHAVTLEAAGAPHATPTPHSTLVVGSSALASSQLAGSRRPSRASTSDALHVHRVAPAPPSPAHDKPTLPPRPMSNAYPWETRNQMTPAARAAPKQTLLATVELRTEQDVPATRAIVLRDSWRVCLRVSVFNVSSVPMTLSAEWMNAAPNTLVSKSTAVAIGEVAPGTAQVAYFWIEALERGMHDLGSLVIRDHAGEACRLHGIGAVAVC